MPSMPCSGPWSVDRQLLRFSGHPGARVVYSFATVASIHAGALVWAFIDAMNLEVRPTKACRMTFK